MSRETDITARCSKEFNHVVDITGDFLKTIGPHLIQVGFFAVLFARRMKQKSIAWKKGKIEGE